MRKRTFRLVVTLGVMCIIGIILVQMYWVRKAYDVTEKSFNQSIQIALKNVATSVSRLNGGMLANPNPVNQLSSDYYVVNVNTHIDANVLQHYLKEEFARLHVHTDYEYAIYDCQTNRMEYGNYISANASEKPGQEKRLPTYNAFTYYFGIRFPTKTAYIGSQMDIWIFSSVLLLAVVGFFGYAIMVILNQERLSEIQKDFINNMTHEFKTPIATIAVSSDVLMAPKIVNEPGKLFTYASIIKQENERLQRGVEKVLQMATVDKNKMNLRLEKVDLNELAHNVVEGFQLKMDKHAGEITEQLHARDAVCQADRLHITNVLHNLVDNAFKYSGKDARVKVSTQNQNGQLVISVTDNGPGISKEHQKKIWDKFYRVPTGNVHNVKGFGLGLNYVRHIVLAHKWKIELDSQPGEGSTFRIIIPTT